MGKLIAFNPWLESVGVDRLTGYRWRKKGWLQTINISGRLYISQESIDEFHRRAQAGDFAQEPAVTRRARLTHAEVK